MFFKPTLTALCLSTVLTLSACHKQVQDLKPCFRGTIGDYAVEYYPHNGLGSNRLEIILTNNEREVYFADSDQQLIKLELQNSDNSFSYFADTTNPKAIIIMKDAQQRYKNYLDAILMTNPKCY